MTDIKELDERVKEAVEKAHKETAEQIKRWNKNIERVLQDRNEEDEKVVNDKITKPHLFTVVGLIVVCYTIALVIVFPIFYVVSYAATKEHFAPVPYTVITRCTKCDFLQYDDFYGVCPECKGPIERGVRVESDGSEFWRPSTWGSQKLENHWLSNAEGLRE